MAQLISGRFMSAMVRQCSAQAARLSARPLPVAVAAAARPGHLLAVRAASSSPADSNNISNQLMEQMRGKIQEALSAQLVEVVDMQGDGRHVEIMVVSKEFEGKSAVNRQRMVYKAIWEELQDTVHAVDAMVTRTPEEAGM